jgi:tRNA dimethylallyltransferase
MNQPSPRIIVICGPTGIGKTASAISLARMFNGEIINADSMQVYQYMDIGTAKPSPSERAAIPHHMIDIIAPDEPFDAAVFASMGRDKIMELNSRGVVPFVAGGTGLYIKALTRGIFQSEAGDPDIRENLKKTAREKGTPFLHDRLREVDPETAGRVHPNDMYRIVRALEVFEITNIPISCHHQEHRFGEALFDVLKIGLTMDRTLLYDRINRRVDAMIAQGLLEETQQLLNRGYSDRLKPMNAIGYRHMTTFMRGQFAWEDAVETLKRDTRRYAKRQFTWFKADPDIIWTQPEKIEEILPAIKKFLQLL